VEIRVITVGSGIDRLDNTKGYIIGNIVSCCTICNIIRGEHLSAYEMQEVAKLICKLRNI